MTSTYILEFDEVHGEIAAGDSLRGRVISAAPVTGEQRIKLAFIQYISLDNIVESKILESCFISLKAGAQEQDFLMVVPQSLKGFHGHRLSVKHALLCQDAQDGKSLSEQYTITVSRGSADAHDAYVQCLNGPKTVSVEQKGEQQSIPTIGFVRRLLKNKVTKHVGHQWRLDFSVSEQSACPGGAVLAEMRFSHKKKGQIARVYIDLQCIELFDDNYEQAPLFQQRFILGNGLDYEGDVVVLRRQEIVIPDVAYPSFRYKNSTIIWKLYLDVHLDSGKHHRLEQIICVKPVC